MAPSKKTGAKKSTAATPIIGHDEEDLIQVRAMRGAKTD